MIIENEDLHIEQMDKDIYFMKIGERSYNIIISGWLWWRKIEFIPQDRISCLEKLGVGYRVIK